MTSPHQGRFIDNPERPPARHDSLAGQSAFADRRSAPALPSVLRCACPPSRRLSAQPQSDKPPPAEITSPRTQKYIPCRAADLRPLTSRDRRPLFSPMPFHADDLVPRCHALRCGNDSIGATLPCLFLIAVLPAWRPRQSKGSPLSPVELSTMTSPHQGRFIDNPTSACLQGMTHLRGKALSPTAALPMLSPPCFAAHVLHRRFSAQPQSDKPADLHHPSRATPSDRGSGAL